jgi:hypothetical protein
MCCTYADRWRKEEEEEKEKEFYTKGTKKRYRENRLLTPWLFNAGKKNSPSSQTQKTLFFFFSFRLVEKSRERT